MDETTHNRAVYNKIFEQWDEATQEPEYWREEFDRFKKLLPQGRVIDLGCGSGRDAGFFKEKYEYTGIDITENLLSLARARNPEARFIQMDMLHLDFPPGIFDGFWAAASLLHISKSKLPGVLAGIKKIVKPDGIGFISVKEGEGEKVVEGDIEGDERFFAFWRLDEFAKVLTDRGFEVLESYRTVKVGKDKREKTWLCYFVKV